MEENSLKDCRQRGGQKREIFVELTPSGRILKLIINANTTAGEVKIQSELSSGIPSDVQSLEAENMTLANDEVVSETVQPSDSINLKLTLSPWWLGFISACMKGEKEKVGARIKIRMSEISREDRIFVAAFTAAQRGDHSLLFSVIAGRKIDAKRRVQLSGRTLLHAAIFGGSISCVTNILVNGGSSLLEASDVTGETPFQLAHRLHGDGCILHLLTMYLELNRRKTSVSIWSIIDSNDSSSSSNPENLQENSPEATGQGSEDEGESEVVAPDSESCTAEQSESNDLSFGPSDLLRSCRVVDETLGTERSCELETPHDTSQRCRSDKDDEHKWVSGKPKIPTLRQRRRMSRERRNAHAPVNVIVTEPTTNLKANDTEVVSLGVEPNKFIADKEEKETSDIWIASALDINTKQTQKPVLGFDSPSSRNQRKLGRSLQAPLTLKLPSRDSSPGSCSSNGEEFVNMSDLNRREHKSSEVFIETVTAIADSAQDKSCPLPAIKGNRNNEHMATSDYQAREKHVSSSAPLPPAQPNKTRPHSASTGPIKYQVTR